MLSLKPGQPLQLRKGNICVTGTLVEIGETELTLSLEGDMDRMTADELELEIPQEKEAPCLLRGRVKRLCPGNICTLELIGESSLKERRQFQRIPTNFKAQYLLIPEREGKREHLEGEILDLSSGGALLTTEDPLAVDSELLLTFQIPLGKEEGFTTGLGGRVVREHSKLTSLAYGYGVEFNRRLAISG